MAETMLLLLAALAATVRRAGTAPLPVRFPAGLPGNSLLTTDRGACGGLLQQCATPAAQASQERRLERATSEHNASPSGRAAQQQQQDFQHSQQSDAARRCQAASTPHTRRTVTASTPHVVLLGLQTLEGHGPWKQACPATPDTE